MASKPPVHQLFLFQRLRCQLLGNNLLMALKLSKLRLVIILLCSMLIWGGIFVLAARAFHFLNDQHIPLAGGIVGTVFDFLFLALSILLLFSGGIILYSSLFSSAETSFLLTTPAAADQVFAYKFQGAIMFSSWAFLLLGSPVLVAYGLAFDVAWYYYALLVLFFLGFVLLPGSLGAFACLMIVNFLPRHFKQVLVALVLLALAGISLWIYSIKPSNWGEALNRDFVQRLVGQLSLAQGPLSPNHWMSRGVEEAARGNLSNTFYYLALIWSNGLFFYLLTAFASARLYRRGFNRLTTGGTLKRRYGGHWLDHLLTGLVGFLDPQTRLLIVKDFRMFRRDPAQWAQVLIFTGLMILYFTNMRRFYQEELLPANKNGVSLMNLAVTALLLCAYTGRFIFPMLSLEGRKFWILGLLPFQRERLLWGKFAFSATWSLLIAEFLVLFSDFMLGMGTATIALHALIVLVLALGLSGLSVGLGAWVPNFRESDPSKIAVGFGGTLNLIICLLYLLTVIGLMAAPWHLRLILNEIPDGRTFPAVWQWVGVGVGIVFGAAAMYFPLRIGARALRHMEF
jgi:ABC-2 type transport system permease protein